MTGAPPYAQLFLGYMRDWLYYKNPAKHENSPISGCLGDCSQPVYKYAPRVIGRACDHNIFGAGCGNV